MLHMACLPGLTMFPMFIPCLSNQFSKQQKLKELIRTGFWLRWKLSQVTPWPGMVTAVYFWFILWRVDPLPMVIWTQLTDLIGPRPWKYVWRNALFANTVFFVLNVTLLKYVDNKHNLSYSLCIFLKHLTAQAVKRSSPTKTALLCHGLGWYCEKLIVHICFSLSADTGQHNNEPRVFAMLYHHNCWPPNFSDHVLPHFFIQRVLKGTRWYWCTFKPQNHLNVRWFINQQWTFVSRAQARISCLSTGKSGIDGDSPCQIDLKNRHVDIVFQNLWYYCRQLMSIWCSILFDPKRK